MMTSAPTVFVSSATGNIGGGLARELRNTLGWTVKTTVRDLESPKAQALQAIGVQIFKGDWDDVASLKTAIAGSEKLFICTATYVEDPDRERVHAENLVRAAREVGGVKQIVSSSSVGVFNHDATGQKHQHSTFFNSVMTAKEIGEEAISKKDPEQDWSWTLLRPAIFMSNFFAPGVDYFSPGFRAEGVWRSTMTAESKLALVEPTDIGKIAAVVLQHPEQYNGRAVGVAGDVLTVDEMLQTLGSVTGKSYKPHYMTEDEIAKEKEAFCFTIAERSLRFMADQIDLAELSTLAKLTDFKAFLDKEDALVKETYL